MAPTPINDPDRLHELYRRATLTPGDGVGLSDPRRPIVHDAVPDSAGGWDRDSESRNLAAVRLALQFQTLQGTPPPPCGDVWQDKAAMSAFLMSELVHPQRRRTRAEFAAPLVNSQDRGTDPECAVRSLRQYREIVALDLPDQAPLPPMPVLPVLTPVECGADEYPPSPPLPESVQASIREHQEHAARLVREVLVARRTHSGASGGAGLGERTIRPQRAPEPEDRTRPMSLPKFADIFGISRDVLIGMLERGELAAERVSVGARTWYLSLPECVARWPDCDQHIDPQIQS